LLISGSVKNKFIFLLTLFLIFSLSCNKNKKKSSAEVGPGQKIVIKVVRPKESFPFYCVGIEKFKEVLEKETKGAVKVEIIPEAQFGSEEQKFLSLKQGTIEASFISSSGLADFVPQIKLFNLPFLFRSLDHFYQVADGSIGQLIGRLIEDKLNCIFLGWTSAGVRNVWNNKRPVLKPDDLEGLKIRVRDNPIVVSTFKALGAQSIPGAWSELYTDFQQGNIDGAETTLLMLLRGRFYEGAKYVSLTNHLVETAVFLFSQDKYQKLPPYVQTTVLAAGRAGILASRQAEAKMSAETWAELKEKGLKFYNIEKEVFRKKAQPVYKKYADHFGGLKLIGQITK